MDKERPICQSRIVSEARKTWDFAAQLTPSSSQLSISSLNVCGALQKSQETTLHVLQDERATAACSDFAA